MTALISAGLNESLQRGWPTAWLVDIDWPDAAVRLWDGLGDLRWNGKTFTGVRNMGRILGIGGAKQLKVRSVTLELIGVGPDVDEFLDPVVRNRTAQAYFAGLKPNGHKVNGDPEEVVSGRCDQREVFVDESRRAGIRLTISEPSYQIERAQNLRYTPEWIKERYGDNIVGLNLLSKIELERIPWTQT